MKNTVITPPAVRLKITGNCNRSCFFCHQEGDMEGIFNISPDIKFFECLDNMISALCINRIMVTGGEPLLHPQLLEIINGIKSNHAELKRKHNFIKWWYNCITKSDAILVCNYDKNGIKNYIGGNTLMEIGFAHVHNKKIFLLNPIPEVSYKDEIGAMCDVILNGNLNKIK